ncbi:MAG: polysaccharide deacetylase family protein, partial [Spirochaetes bacterium]|nr:polysaccharide deacetylase family protein [Spirochaetota bacterium]
NAAALEEVSEPAAHDLGVDEDQSLRIGLMAQQMGQDDGKAFDSPMGGASSVFIRGNLAQAALRAGEAASVLLERRFESASPVDKAYAARPVVPLAGPGSETLELSIDGTDLGDAALADYPDGARLAAVQSWDDGIESDVRAAQLMKKHGWRASFFFNKHSKLLERSQELEALGMEVASHSWSHPAYWLQTPERCRDESLACRTLLEEKTGHPVISFAYPFNYGAAWDAEGDYVLRAQRVAGYLAGRSTANGPTTLDAMGEPLALKTDSHFLAPRERLLEAWERAAKASRGIFYIWGHTYEMVKDSDWAAYEGNLEFFGRKSDAWYASQGDLSVWKWMRENVKVETRRVVGGLKVKLTRPKLNPWWAARVPVALKVPGQLTSVQAEGACAQIVNGVVQVEWR